MKISEAIHKVNKENPQWVDIWSLAEELGIQNSLGDTAELEHRFKEYHLTRWICTDTWVGIYVIYLDDKPVCVTRQNARKSYKMYFWVSPEAKKKVVEELEKCCLKEDNSDYIELAEDIDDFFTVNFSGELLDDSGFYQGKPCVVTDKFRKDFTAQKVKVKFDDGLETVIPVSEFKIPINVEKTI